LIKWNYIILEAFAWSEVTHDEEFLYSLRNKVVVWRWLVLTSTQPVVLFPVPTRFP